MKSFLFVLRKPAHSGAYLQEMLDIILTTAAFDQAVSLLLLDDGVFALKKHQAPDCQGLKDTAAIFKALECYDVNHIHLETESLTERGLSTADLSLPVISCPRKELASLIQQFDVIFPG